MTVAPPPDNPTPKRHRRRVPNAESHRLYDSWITLLPTLADSLMAFMSNSMGCLPPPQVGRIIAHCTDGTHEMRTLNIACLYFNRKLRSFLFAIEISTHCRLHPHQRNGVHLRNHTSSSSPSWPLSNRPLPTSHGRFHRTFGFLSMPFRAIVRCDQRAGCSTARILHPTWVSLETISCE